MGITMSLSVQGGSQNQAAITSSFISTIPVNYVNTLLGPVTPMTNDCSSEDKVSW